MIEAPVFLWDYGKKVELMPSGPFRLTVILKRMIKDRLLLFNNTLSKVTWGSHTSKELYHLGGRSERERERD